MGLSGNLTTGEILEQIVHADRILAEEYEEVKARHADGPPPKVDLVRNVVFMGMYVQQSLFLLTLHILTCEPLSSRT